MNLTRAAEYCLGLCLQTCLSLPTLSYWLPPDVLIHAFRLSPVFQMGYDLQYET